MIGQDRGLMQYFRLLNTYITFHFFDKFIAILYIFLEFHKALKYIFCFTQVSFLEVLGLNHLLSPAAK